MQDFGAQEKSEWENFWGIFAKKPKKGSRWNNIFTFYPDLLKAISGFAISPALLWSMTYIVLLGVLAQLIPNLPLFAFDWLIGTAPFWVPIALSIGSLYMWMGYVHAEFLSSKHPILLELKVPREIHKSPRAMELALNQLHMTGGETTFIHRWWRGSVRVYYSLELVSIGGNIHYYIWTWRDFRVLIERALLAQFPDMEIEEVEDYASRFAFDQKKHIVWCTDYRLAHLGDSPLKAFEHILPLRSYIDFELEHSHAGKATPDPLAYVIDYMSNIKPDEQMWIQILMRGTSRDVEKTAPFTYKQTWYWQHHKATEEIRNESLTDPADPTKRLEQGNLTPRMRTQLDALDRNAAKRPFDFLCRGAYITNPKDINGVKIPGFRMIWRPFGSMHLGSLEPKGWSNAFDYPWEDYRGIRKALVAKRFIDRYRRRSGFYPPWKTPYQYVTAETLATIFHFLPQTVATPGLDRQWNTKVEPPLNLPL